MGNLKKVVSLLSAVSILSSLVVSTAFAATFSDVPANAYYYEAVEALVTEGVVDGTKGTYNPAGSLQRDESAKFVVSAADLAADLPDTATFSDVPLTAWSFEFVEKAYANGVVNGYKDAAGNLTGKYGPSDKVTREQYAKMVVEAFDLPEYTPSSPTFPDVSESMWSYTYVETAYHWSVINGYANGKFGPTDNIVRQDGAVMTYRALDPTARAEGDDDDDDDDTVYTGDLDVSLNSGSPDGATVPSKATSVPVAIFDFEANGGDTELDALTVHMYGVGATTAVSNLYLYDGNERLTSGKTVNSTTKEALFNNLGLVIDKGDTLSITLRMDVAELGAAGLNIGAQEAGFELESVDAVDAGSADIGGSFPVKGDKFDLSTTNAGTVTVTKNGTVSNPKVGEDDVELAKFKMAADGEAANIEQVGVYFSGTIATDAIENLELFVSGETDPIATVDGLNGKDIAQFVLEDSFEMEKGATKAFTVKGDLNTGRNGDTVLAYIDENTDIVAIGDTYGFGMAVVTSTPGTYDGASCTASTGNCSGSTLQGGDITVSSNGPAASDIAINGKDVALMDFSVTSVSEATFKSFEIGLTASDDSADATEGLLSTTTPNFTDIKVVNKEDGSTLMGPVDSDSFRDNTYLLAGAVIDETTDDLTTGAYYRYTDEFFMDAGEELDLSITADVRNSSTLAGMTIAGIVNIDASTPEVRDTNNKVITNSSSIVPSSPINGHDMTVMSPDLTMALAATPVSKTYVKGSKNVKFTGIIFNCGSASDCNITDVTLQGYLDDDGGANGFVTDNTGANADYLKDYVGMVWLTDTEGTTVAAAKSVQTDGSVAFTNLNWALDAGENTAFYVVGDISNDSFKDSDAENIAFGIAATTDVTYEDSDGTTRNPSGVVINTSQSTYVTTSDGGTLTIDVDAGTPNENIVVAGTSDVEISKFKFTSTDEPFLIQELSIVNRDGTNPGDWDNNVLTGGIKIAYPTIDGTMAYKTATLSGGVAKFTGLEMYVEEDDDASMTVSANLNTIAGGATAGEFVEFNVGLNNFKAVAQGSGETYSISTMNDTDGAGGAADGTLTNEKLLIAGFDDSSFVNTVTYTNDAGDLVGTTTLGGSTSFKIDNNGADQTDLPIGAFLCMTDAGADTACNSNTDDIYVVTAWTDGATEDTVTATLASDGGDGTYDAADEVLYAIPAEQYLTTTHQMHVYESKPTIALASSSPSGSRNVAASDDAFVFTVKADSQEAIKVNAGIVLAVSDGYDAAGTNNAAPAAIATTGNHLDGSATKQTLTGFQVGDSLSFDGTTAVANYDRLSFWMKWEDAAAVASPAFADFKVNVIDSATTDPTGGTALSATTCSADAADLVDGTAASEGDAEWYFCDLDITALNADASDRYVHFEFDEMTELLAADSVYFDDVKLYDEKIVVNVATDVTDIDTYALNTSNANSPSEAYLKDGSTTVATGYWNTATNGASATSSATITFIPTTEFVVAKGTTKTITLRLDSADLINEDGGSDDPVTFSISLGSSTDGTVSAGGFWWNETNATVKWFGDVTSNTLNSNTLRY